MDAVDITILAVRLQSEDPEIQTSAARKLAELCSIESVKVLLRAMADDDVELEKTALDALRQAPREALVEVLSHYDVNSGIWKHVARVLGHLGTPEALALLETALVEGGEDARITASMALIDSGPHAVPILLRALHHEAPEIRARAAMALGRMRAAEATNSLIGMVQDDSAEVRLEAILALAGIGAPEAVPALIQALEDPAEQVRHTVPVALGEIGTTEAVEALKAACQSEDQTLAWMADWELNQITAGKA